jgi:hypothetical protein
MTRFFAQLNDSNEVVHVECLDDENSVGADGVHSEAIGIAFLQHLFGDLRYVETRDEDGFRGSRQASPGDTWDPVGQRFYPLIPFEGAVWDDETNAWLAPLQP